MRIAIVEDEQDLALELHALLQKLGSHSIALFPGGEQFLFAWEEQPYDLVFLDIFMEGMNGMDERFKDSPQGAGKGRTRLSCVSDK